MTRLVIVVMAAGLTFPAVPSVPASAAETPAYRLAYVEATPYWSYDEHFEEFKKALDRLGWGGRVSFPPELRFSWGDSEADIRAYPEKARSLLARDDCDLVLSFGTEATRVLLAENEAYGRRLLGLSISNPLGAGLIRGPGDSGSPHFATVSFGEVPGPYMFVLFHHLIPFKRLGLMYHDSPSGRAYTYLNDAREVARDRGFELVEDSGVGAGETPADCRAAVDRLLARGVDALFIPNINCFGADPEELAPMYEKLLGRGVPTFAAEDEAQVRRFALMGLLFSDAESLGAFQAGQAVRILSGEEPGDVPMIAPFRCQFLLNLAVAERLGLRFGPDVISLSDRLYLTRPDLPPRPEGRP